MRGFPKNDNTKPWQFKKGQSGNPAGRPKGCRNKLGENFLRDLAEDWEKNGATAIKDCREKKPAEYVKVVAGLLPRELLVKQEPLKELSDGDLEQLIDALRDHITGDVGSAPRPTHGRGGTA